MAESKAEYVQYDHHSIIQITLNDHTYQFNADWIPENRRDWLADVVMSSLQEAYRRGQEDKRKEVRQAVRNVVELLGL